MFGKIKPERGRALVHSLKLELYGLQKLSLYTLFRRNCQQNPDDPWEVRKQRGLRAKGINCEFSRNGTCSCKPACSGDPQLSWSYGGGNLGLNRLYGYLVQRVGGILVLHGADYCTVGGWASRTQQPSGCRHDKLPGGILMLCSVAFLGEREMYLQGKPVLLKKWLERRLPARGGEGSVVPPPLEAPQFGKEQQIDRHKEITFSFYTVTGCQRGLVADPRCSQRGRRTKRWD